MLPNRTRSLLLVGFLVFAAALPAFADIRDLQFFAPADVSPYGNGPQPPEGFFFTFDQMFWYINRPSVQPIGRPGGTREVWFGPDAGDFFVQTNTHDTALLRSAELSGSQRYEVGRILDRWGWFVSAYNLRPQHQESTFRNVGVVFEDPEYQVGANPPRRFLQGRYELDTDPVTYSDLLDLPVLFDTMTVTNRVEHWNVELNMMYRTRQLHNGGFLEFFAGARYLEFDDQFMVNGFSPLLEAEDDEDDNGDDNGDDDDNGNDNGNGNGEGEHPLLGILDDSIWDTKADNHVIGPQIGVRWFRQTGRWRLSGEGRFFAGINNQSITQYGVLGSELDPNELVSGRPESVSAQGFSHRATALEFSPAWEVRANLHYQFTRAISFKVGWTGFWMDSVARASSMVDYEVNNLSNASMGINMANNRQAVFMHGMNIGVEVNR
ncbi:MAG: BBP7 family outer membrane beta-barrel protein [Thermoguttaceae bacterium]